MFFYLEKQNLQYEFGFVVRTLVIDESVSDVCVCDTCIIIIHYYTIQVVYFETIHT